MDTYDKKNIKMIGSLFQVSCSAEDCPNLYFSSKSYSDNTLKPEIMAAKTHIFHWKAACRPRRWDFFYEINKAEESHISYNAARGVGR